MFIERFLEMIRPQTFVASAATDEASYLFSLGAINISFLTERNPAHQSLNKSSCIVSLHDVGNGNLKLSAARGSISQDDKSNRPRIQ